jgi:hypothetical protein
LVFKGRGGRQTEAPPRFSADFFLTFTGHAEKAWVMGFRQNLAFGQSAGCITQMDEAFDPARDIDAIAENLRMQGLATIEAGDEGVIEASQLFESEASAQMRFGILGIFGDLPFEGLKRFRRVSTQEFLGPIDLRFYRSGITHWPIVRRR